MINRYYREKKLSKMDILLYYHLYHIQKPLTANGLMFALGYSRSRLSESLNRLINLNLIQKTDKKPYSYYIKDGI